LTGLIGVYVAASNLSVTVNYYMQGESISNLKSTNQSIIPSIKPCCCFISDRLNYAIWYVRLTSDDMYLITLVANKAASNC
jgi:membrane-bound acyltransferase YfiQ involved in biofilm formation